MFINDDCFGLFVDIANNIYCSLRDLNQVVKKPINSGLNMSIIVAGSTCTAPISNTLDRPHGIFVDINFDLYVADCGNNRIQLFSPNQLNGTTVAGRGSSNKTISLDCPTGIVLDADKYLFIVDKNNHRIVGSGSNGFRCVVGCYSNGDASNVLNHPHTMAFDSDGNIYVTDKDNDRIQKFVLMDSTNVSSYNTPKFDSSTTWSCNAITFSDVNSIGISPYNIYISTNNTIYVANYPGDRVQIWLNNGSNLTKTISHSVSFAYAIFVKVNGDIYVSSESFPLSYYIDKLTFISNSSTIVPTTFKACYGLFVDIVNNLYCSIPYMSCVQKKPLDSNTSVWVTVAGCTGLLGGPSNTLFWPYGIFVDVNFDLYVADCGNDRIQLFHFGELSATTVAGYGSSNKTISLNCPSGVVLDADKYLFIVDNSHNRIVGSNANGFRCVAGCSGLRESTSDTLSNPFSMAFDSYGNIYVTDTDNHRIQKFILSTNSCNQTLIEEPILTSTIVQTETSSSITVDQDISSTAIITQETLSSTAITVEPPAPKPFFPSSCSDPNTIGTNCTTSSDPCNLLNPCQNNGTCMNSTTAVFGYTCVCPRGFDGDNCQNDRRPCKPNTCWNNGTCNEITPTKFQCTCQAGWTGDHCQIMINYCQNVKCENNGVCRPLFMNYSCDCLGDHFSGRHCEIIARKAVVLRFISKSFAYIAISFLVIVAAFFVIMDILKYCFGIDPAKHELEWIRREKARKRAKPPPVIQKFRYIDAPPTEQRPKSVKTRRRSSNIQKTNV